MPKKILTKELALKIILGVSIGGILFSGYLTIIELTTDPLTCPACNQGLTILGLPVCVYGLIMYITVLIFSVLGLLSKK